MKAAEKKYAIERLTTIRNRKLHVITARHTTPGVNLTPPQRAVALRKGEFKVKPVVKAVEGYTNIRDVFTFNAEKDQSVDKVAIQKENKALNAAFNNVCDQVMLGDGSKALALIEKFEK